LSKLLLLHYAFAEEKHEILPEKAQIFIRKNHDDFHVFAFLIFSIFSLYILNKMTTIAIIDDHEIFCDSLTALINDVEGFNVIWTAQSGKKAIELMQQPDKIPAILLLDINMPEMSGIEVAEWVFKNNISAQMLALTMEDDDNSVIKMLQYGVKGYFLKGGGADKLLDALQSIIKHGFYYTPLVAKQINNQLSQKNKNAVPELKEKEKELLQYMCSDRTYTEIAKEMLLSESTVDTYRAKLFDKFNVKNRIGLLIKANAMGLVKI
jgi:DNA-binding NarL/FixJ family response regulator